MSEPYVAVFTPWTWQRFLDAGALTAGFPMGSEARAAHLSPGDRLLCYVVDRKVWIGALEVAGPSSIATVPPIWGTDAFPIRTPVEPLVVLDIGIPAAEVVAAIPRLRAADLRQRGSWAGFVRRAPRLWPSEDGDVVYNMLVDAAQAANDVTQAT